MLSEDSKSPNDTDSQLDTVIKLLAAIVARGLDKGQAIIRLDKMRLSREQIADAIGVSTHNVSQVLYASKKAEKNTKKDAKANGTDVQVQQL